MNSFENTKYVYSGDIVCYDCVLNSLNRRLEHLQDEGSENPLAKIRRRKRCVSRFGVALIGLDKMKVWITTIHRITAWTTEKFQ